MNQVSPDQYFTRPGTPMVGEYSTNQMDNFYEALSRGEVKPSGLMNCAQHLYVAERCKTGDTVVDVCCGRGLQLPLLYRYAPDVGGYMGLDISKDNIEEAREHVRSLDTKYERTFPVDFVECDVSEQWPSEVPQANVMVYTSALEHLPREKALASLRNCIEHLAPGGTLYLSTPNTPGEAPRPLQYRVHVYEWNFEELAPELEQMGARIKKTIGLLPPEADQLGNAIAAKFGQGALDWWNELQATVPPAFLAPIGTAAVPEVSMELMYVVEKS